MSKIAWVRLAYWAGIIADAVVAVFMLFPRLDTRLFGTDIVSDPVYGLGLRRGISLMVGWTVLLFWADRKPVERRDVLLITLCPVMIGYMIYEVYALANGFTSLNLVIPGLIIDAAFSSLFAAGYLMARHLSCQEL